MIDLNCCGNVWVQSLNHLVEGKVRVKNQKVWHLYSICYLSILLQIEVRGMKRAFFSPVNSTLDSRPRSVVIDVILFDCLSSVLERVLLQIEVRGMKRAFFSPVNRFIFETMSHILHALPDLKKNLPLYILTRCWKSRHKI
jgi:hypothetical protein